MAILDIFATPPYFTRAVSDNTIAVLYKPGFPVQSRELNEVQINLLNQLGRFANHIFTNGSKVTGGDIIRKRVTYVKLQNTYGGVAVTLADWLGKYIYPDGSPDTKALVIAVEERTTTELPTIYLEFDGAVPPITANTVIRVSGTGLAAQVYADPNDFTGTSLFYGVNSGVYYIDGYFCMIPASSIIVQKYGDKPTGSLGFVYTTPVVTADDDENLLDPARNSRNWSAPGADRLVMRVELKFFSEGDEQPDNFVKLVELVNGETTEQKNVPIYSDLAREFARRTYDESGSYTVRAFKATARDHIGVKLISITHDGPAYAHKFHAKTATKHDFKPGDRVTISGVTGADASIYNGTFTVELVEDYQITGSLSAVPVADATIGDMVASKTDWATAEISPGKAYVFGYEYETIANNYVDFPRARSTAVGQNYSISASYGNYVTAQLVGWINPNTGDPKNILDATDSVIGTCRVISIKHHSGTPGSGAARYRLYLADVRITAPGKSFDDARKIDDTALGVSGGEAILDLSGSKPVMVNSSLNGLVFRVPEEAVKTLMPGGVLDTSFTTLLEFNGVVSGPNNEVSFSVTGDRQFIGPIGVDFAGTDIANTNFICFRAGASGVLNPTYVFIDPSTKQVTLQFAGVGVTAVKAFIAVSERNLAAKTKTITSGQKVINYTDASTVFSLEVPDVFEITSITDGANEYKSSFTLDTGMRPAYYDHSSIVRTGANLPVPNGTPLTVHYRRFAHSGTGYFSADSYSGIPYELVPSFTDANTGKRSRMTDCLDFRPVRAGAGTTYSNAEIPIADTSITADIEFYLPRRDRIVLTAGGEFKVIQGTPSLNPLLPAEPANAMTLYETYVRAYTHDVVKDVDLKFIENKRFTMRDIGKLEKRIDRLEYYTTLSLLELSTTGRPVVDANGLDRFKNGFLVDEFAGHKIGDVYSGDYRCSIDPGNRELRPAFLTANAKLSYTPASSSAFQVGNSETGFFLTLPFDEVMFLDHPNATKAESVNPYLVIDFRGSLTCNPPSDDWMDTTRSPAVNVDLTGDLDAWNYMVNAVNASVAPGFGTQWNDWQTTWTGVDTNISTTDGTRGRGNLVEVVRTTTTTTTTTRNQVRTGTQTSLGVTEVTQSLGDRVVDVNLSYFMREVDIAFTGAGLRPNTNLHVFVDDTKVNDQVTPEAGYEPTTEGCIRTDASGFVRGHLHINEGQFRTGERVIMLIDEPNKVVANASTYASYVFPSSGLSVTKQDTIVSTRQPAIISSQVTDTRVVRDVVSESTSEVVRVFQIDPLAQTFWISREAYPFGVFITSIDLFFRRKPADDTHTVFIQIRPTVNGYPHASKIIPMSEVHRLASQVAIPTTTDDIASIRSAPTTFSFPVPIYLEPGQEYAVVVLSNSSEYEAYIGEIGEKVFGTNKILAQQPSLGSLFKSQNSRTWTAVQTEDLMLRIRRASFNTGSVASVVCQNVHDQTIRANLVRVQDAVLNFEPATSVTREYRIKDAGTGSIPAEWTPLQPDANNYFPSEKLLDANGTFLTRTTLSTTRDDVAPLMDLTKNSAIFVHNLINDDDTGEDGTHGGNALARYLTRRVTLADDFVTDYMEVILDVNQPAGTDIKVYYKSVSPDDPTPLDQRPWVEMTRSTTQQIISGNADDFREVKFVPVGGTMSYISNGITYPYSQTYAIKIVMLSGNTSIVPRVRDMRAITAVPA